MLTVKVPPVIDTGHGPLVGSNVAVEAADKLRARLDMGSLNVGPLSEREKKEIQERVAAMSIYELEAVLEVIPVGLCMNRIQNELDRAREFESMIKKAYEMK